MNTLLARVCSHLMVTGQPAVRERAGDSAVSAFAMRNRRGIVLAAEIATICVSLAAAFQLRFEFALPEDQYSLLWRGMALALPLKFGVFRLTGLERRSFRFTSFSDVPAIAAACSVGSLGFAILARSTFGPLFPRSVYLIDFLLCFAAIAGLRLMVRQWWESRTGPSGEADIHKRILIYGAGVAGVTLLRRIRTDLDFGARVVAFVDDDPAKHNTIIHGVPVSGPGGELQQVIRQCRADEIWIAAPSAPRRQQKQIAERCRGTGLAFRNVPTLTELVTGAKPVEALREISSRELIGRNLIDLSEKRLETWLSDQRIVVTGAAGSIGSELCRQAAACGPRLLVAVDHSEGGLFDLERQLREEFPGLSLAIEIADIAATSRMAKLLSRHRASVIYHAAAYKHVPLMERHLALAVENNALAVHRLLQAADDLAVESFVLISSDKAVRPSSVMGASKRLAELAVCSFPASRIRPVAVRFGNVLGSSGSLLPILRKQIAAGGPVTITHPEMTRFFMGLHEAVSLVLQAGFLGSGREIFVLDMGAPVRIVDLAERLIRLNGYEPRRDIEITFTGPRPGEKLHEELAYPFERLTASPNQKILVASNRSFSFPHGAGVFRDLESLVSAGDERGLLTALETLIPEFTPGDLVRDSAGTAAAAVRRARV